MKGGRWVYERSELKWEEKMEVQQGNPASPRALVWSLPEQVLQWIQPRQRALSSTRGAWYLLWREPRTDAWSRGCWLGQWMRGRRGHTQRRQSLSDALRGVDATMSWAPAGRNRLVPAWVVPRQGNTLN